MTTSSPIVDAGNSYGGNYINNWSMNWSIKHRIYLYNNIIYYLTYYYYYHLFVYVSENKIVYNFQPHLYEDFIDFFIKVFTSILTYYYYALISIPQL
jgi:hypothetical protein